MSDTYSMTHHNFASPLTDAVLYTVTILSMTIISKAEHTDIERIFEDTTLSYILYSNNLEESEYNGYDSISKKFLNTALPFPGVF